MMQAESVWYSYPLPISKLRGLPPSVRGKLKACRITTCAHLLEAAGDAKSRAVLARAASIDPYILENLVCRADLARINGVGAIFGLMLEALDIVDVADLAQADATELHEALQAYNRATHFARRSPTAGEVASWIAEASRLPILVSYDPPVPAPSRQLDS